MRYTYLRSGVWAVVALLLTWLPTTTQAQADTCNAFAEQAVAQLGANCDGLGRNSACYGYTLVQASLTEQAADDVSFNVPRDRAELVQLNSIRTAPFDEDGNTWGIAVLNTQANLPGTLPGQGVVMMLMGDTEMVSAVPNGTAFTGAEPVTATVTGENVRVRTGAGMVYNVAGVLNVGDVLAIDGRSEDGEWLRAVSGEVGGWIYRGLTDIAADDYAALETVNDQLQAPMQAVYFRSGIGGSGCESAPDMLMIQSPQHIRVDLTINEAQISIGSTVVITTEEVDGKAVMVLYVIDGEASVNNLIVPQGYKAYVDLDIVPEILERLTAQGVNIISTDGLPVRNGEWDTCEAITDAEREQLSIITGIPLDVLNYPITLPDEPDRICASPEELAAFYATDGSLNIGLAIGGVDCSSFAATSPLTGVNWGTQDFYWNAAPGATEYTVTVFDNVGNDVVSGSTDDTNLSLYTGTGNPTGGVNYSWQVEAKNADGETLCRTAPVTVLRGAAPPSYLNPPQSSAPSGGGGPAVCNLLDPGVEYTNCPVCYTYASYDLVACTYTCFTGC